MAKILFNNTNYNVDDASLSTPASALKSHLSTTMNGTGVTIVFGGTTYNIDEAKLSAAMTSFITHLDTIAGNGCKVVINGVEYGIDSNKVSGAVSEFEAVLSGLNAGGGSDAPVALAAGLYETGAIALYEQQGAEEIENMMKISWDELLANGTIHVDNGVVYTDVNLDTYTNPASDILVGDLILPNDNSINAIGDAIWDDETGSMLGHPGLTGCTNITGIVIPDSVTSIGNGAFDSCTSLASVVIPDSVTSIGIGAFYNNSYPFTVFYDGSFNQLISEGFIGEGNDSIFGATIYTKGARKATEGLAYRLNDDKSSLTVTGYTGTDSEVTIPAMIDGQPVTHINRAFEHCTTITSVIIPDTVISMGDFVTFQGCTNLTSVMLSESLTYIGESAFSECTSLPSIIIPDSVTYISYGAFQHCSSLTSVTIGNGIKDINNYAFNQCTSLTNITFNGTVAEWNNIYLYNNWNNGVPATYVQCTDGQVAL